MVHQPRRVIRSVVENHIRQAQEAIFLLGDLQSLLDLVPSSASRFKLTGGEESGIVSHLVSDRVGTIALSALLQGRIVQHCVSSFLRFGEMGSPFVKRAHPLTDDGQDGDAIERKVDVSVLYDGPFAWGKHG